MGHFAQVKKVLLGFVFLFSHLAFAHNMPESIKKQKFIESIEHQMRLAKFNLRMTYPENIHEYILTEDSVPELFRNNDLLGLLAGIPTETEDIDHEGIQVQLNKEGVAYIARCETLRSSEKKHEAGGIDSNQVSWMYSIKYLSCYIENPNTKRRDYLGLGSSYWSESDQY